MRLRSFSAVFDFFFFFAPHSRPRPRPRSDDRALSGFVGRVPRGVLVGASTRVRAYTRALRYLEEQIRAEHAARLRATGGRSVSLLFDCFTA